MTGEQRHIDHAPDDTSEQPAPLSDVRSLTDAYVAKMNAALGAGDDRLVIELARTYVDEAAADVGTNAPAA